MQRRPALSPILVFLGVLALLAVAVPLLASAHQATTGDGADYVGMARDPGAFPEAPEGFRLLMPWLVAALPGSVTAGFELVTAVMLALTASLLFVWLRTFRPPADARYGVVLFVCSGAVTGAARNPYLVDSMAFTFVALAFALIWRGRFLLLAVVLAAGVLAKETVAFVALAGVALAPRQARIVATVVGLPLAVYACLHFTPLVYADRGNHSYLSDIRGVLRYERTQIGIVRAPVQAVLYSFGPLWIAALVGWRRADSRLRVAALYVVPVVASVVIAADWPRVLGYAFPIVIALTVLVPLSLAARCVLALSVLADSQVFESLPTSAVKETLLLAAFAGGSYVALRTRRMRPTTPSTRAP